MSDGGDDDRDSQAGEEGEEGEFNIPELWRYAQEDKVGKIVKYLNAKEEEELPEAVQEANPESGMSLLMWATLKQKFVLVEWLLKKCKRDAFAFRQKNLLAIYDKWAEERKAKEERDKEAAEEAAARAAEAGDEEEEEEEKEPEPELYTVVAEGIEEEGIDVFVVRRIGELGLFEGGRDAQGNKTGLGQSLFVNGDMYLGEYADNKREGTGTYYWTKEGNIYIGGWKNNQRSGMGRMIYADGGRYYGYWQNDKKNGTGRYTYPNGDSYNGDWEDDRKEGFGTYTFAADSSKYAGTFRNGDFTSGKWLLSGGTLYFGVFKNFKPVGKGVFIFNGKFKQEGEYKGSKWIPNKVQNLKGEDEIDLLITIQGRRMRLRFTPEQAHKFGIEHLVNVANFRPFEKWVCDLEAQSKIQLEDIRIRSLDLDPLTKEIKLVRLQVDAYDSDIGSGQKLAHDNVVLQCPETVISAIISHGGIDYVLGIQKPALAHSDFCNLDLPRGYLDSSGVFRGPELTKLAKVFGIKLEKSNMMDLSELCFGDSGCALYTSPVDNTSAFNMWMYKQEVHSDYFNTLSEKIAAHNKEGDLIKVDMYPLENFISIVFGSRTTAVAMMMQSLLSRMPMQTMDKQRPPTPPPPAPEPAPLYTEEELAMQQAALEAEAAAKKKKGGDDEAKDGEEEEEED